jgi:uroporphyrinogen-III synthase
MTAAAEIDPLSGFTVAITADRRRDDLCALLERHGARVVLAPALRIVPLADDTELRRATVACVDKRLDVVVATTGIGLRGWLEAAEGWGLAEALRTAIGTSHLIARGPKALGRDPRGRPGRLLVARFGELRRGTRRAARRGCARSPDRGAVAR